MIFFWEECDYLDTKLANASHTTLIMLLGTSEIAGSKYNSLVSMSLVSCMFLGKKLLLAGSEFKHSAKFLQVITWESLQTGLQIVVRGWMLSHCSRDYNNPEGVGYYN